MKSLRLLWGSASIIALVLWLGGLAGAQLTYDVANYKALARIIHKFRQEKATDSPKLCY
jgi:hypothetical protein